MRTWRERHACPRIKMPEYDIVGVVSRGPETGGLSQELGGLPEYDSFEKALADTNPTPFNQHLSRHTRRVCEQVLESGAHVFTEKPLAETIDDAQAVVDLGQKDRQKGRGRLHPAASTRPGRNLSKSRGRWASRWSCG